MPGTSERLTEAGQVEGIPTTLSAALVRMAEAEDTLRAIGAGEIDAFVVAGGDGQRHVFTLTTADRPYRMFVENMRDGAATLSPDGYILYANQRLADLLGCRREGVVGSPLSRFVLGDGTRVVNGIREACAMARTFETELVNDEQLPVPVLVGASLMASPDDHLTCLTFTDLSAQRAQEEEIRRLSDLQAQRMFDLQQAQAALTRQASHDALTGLPNRELLVDRLDQALLQARRTGRCVGVYFIDLDRFKLVNDSLGHAAGDTVLRHVADRLGSALRASDTVARIGGDEFVVLAADLDDHLHAAEIGVRLGVCLRESDGVSNHGAVTGSVGVSISNGGSGTAEGMLHEADMAMYRAKSRGGGRTDIFDAALGRELAERTSAKAMLQVALDDRRVVAHYQPIIDTTTGAIAGFEALARIDLGDGKVLSPAAFIHVAEDSGLVTPLGTRMLHLACAAAQRWGFAGHRATIAVNVSSRQFESGDLTSILRTALDDYALAPELLHLEITETAIMDLRPDILDQLGAIRDLGIEIGLDDFGTGYASLTHLRRLPLSFVKIDQTFVGGLGTDRHDERIVSAVVDLAQNLGLRSVAEGVETTLQLDRLRELGCNQAQGYLFARPMDVACVAPLLADNQSLVARTNPRTPTPVP
ncbi:MAG: hypothetical protein NVS3B21_28500 [Acidimicrobiales bacterium]